MIANSIPPVDEQALLADIVTLRARCADTPRALPRGLRAAVLPVRHHADIKRVGASTKPRAVQPIEMKKTHIPMWNHIARANCGHREDAQLSSPSHPDRSNSGVYRRKLNIRLPLLHAIHISPYQ